MKTLAHSVLTSGFVILFLAVLLFAPQPVRAVGLAAASEVIWQTGPNVFFRYANLSKSAAGSNDHPAELQPEQLTKIVQSLQIQGKDAQPEPLFTAEQATLLGRHLAAGLQRARPDQDIIFALERSEERPFFMRSAQFFVAGRAFYRDNRLNIIIGDYDRRRNVAYEETYDPTRVGIARYQFDHGRRARKTKSFKKTVLNVSGVENKQVQGTRRDDWLVIDVPAASAAYDSQARAQRDADIVRRRQELKEVLDGGEAQGLPVEAAPAVPATAPPPRGISWAELEEGLTTLDRLRQRGLITEQEYNTKKQEMLDALGPW